MTLRTVRIREYNNIGMFIPEISVFWSRNRFDIMFFYGMMHSESEEFMAKTSKAKVGDVILIDDEKYVVEKARLDGGGSEGGGETQVFP